MSKHSSDDFADYVPVELRYRHDGWTPTRQVDFLLALSETACVEEACRAVGMSPPPSGTTQIGHNRLRIRFVHLPPPQGTEE
ncbi:MAG TPA: hypothetical protein VK485_08630 [Sphingomicrobium sp.]|nr:hypothetical protein [Sphingomicrobium sp.]